MLEILPPGGQISQAKIVKIKWSEALVDIWWIATNWSLSLQLNYTTTATTKQQQQQN